MAKSGAYRVFRAMERVKIPDACDDSRVPYVNTFDMLR